MTHSLASCLQHPTHAHSTYLNHAIGHFVSEQCLIAVFCRPRCTKAAVLVGATQDAYVSPQSVLELAEHWPGSEVRWVKGGHVSAFLLQQNAFRQAISDSVSRLDQYQEDQCQQSVKSDGVKSTSQEPQAAASV